jgi:hypothetical protein
MSVSFSQLTSGARRDLTLSQIQTSRLVTSYSVSPLASFTCPPCSIRRKNPKTAAERLTYCSIIDPKPKLKCFVQRYGKSSGANGTISSTIHNITDSDSPVVYLDLIADPSSVGEPPDVAVIAVHEDGEVRCLSSDLSREYWKSAPDFSAKGLQGGERKICFATVMHFEEARKGIFKHREDLVARFQRFVDSTATFTPPDLLVLLTKNLSPGADKGSENLRLSIFNLHSESLQARHTKLGRSATNLEHLVSLTVPLPDKKHDGDPLYFFHRPSGVLYQCVDREMRMYDFSGTVPRLAKQIRWKHTIQSCLRLFPTSVMLTSRHLVTILDTQYQSILASTPIDSAIDDRGSSGVGKKEQIQVLSYFSSQGVAVAIQGRTLISLQVIDTDAQITGRKRTRGGKLIDAIGRGTKSSKAHSSTQKSQVTLPESFGKFVELDRVDSKWEELRGQLDSRVAQGNPEAFDSILSTELGIKDDISHSGQHGMNRKALLKNHTRLPRTKSNFLLNKIFKFGKGSGGSNARNVIEPSLMIAFYPKRTFQWLVTNGLLSLSYIETALREAGSLSSTSELHPCAVIQALAIFDASFQVLADLLAAPCYLTTREVVCAARLAIGALQQSEASSEQKMIMNKEENQPTDSDTVMQLRNGDTDPVTNSAQTNETSHNAQTILKHCLSRLRHCHETEIRQTFTRELSHTDLLSFIDFLRMSLARGGWLSRYMDDGYTPFEVAKKDQDQQNEQMSICTKLLNCALDALGTSGWITSASNTTNVFDDAETIAYMKAEVSAALEGIEEAAYLNAMLHEVLLYCKTVKPPKPKPETDEVKPVTVALESWEDHVLPVGLKAEQEVRLTKVRAGGEIQKRSVRDIGRLKSRKVGAYSFERIVI